MKPQKWQKERLKAEQKRAAFVAKIASRAAVNLARETAH